MTNEFRRVWSERKEGIVTMQTRYKENQLQIEVLESRITDYTNLAV